MKRKVLLADSYREMRRAQREILNRDGFIIAGEAANQKEAVELYESLRPDLLFLDIMLPNMDGMNALKKIKTIDPGARVIMYSPLAEVNIVIESLIRGAENFIIKPFGAADLIRAARGAFAEKAPLNKDILKLIYKKYRGVYSLNQETINEIIKIARLSGTADPAVIKFIDRISGRLAVA